MISKIDALISEIESNNFSIVKCDKNLTSVKLVFVGKLPIETTSYTIFGWNHDVEKWDKVGNEVTAKSKITYDLKFNQWHHGKEMNMNDIIYSVYFLSEWGSERTEDDRTYDTDFSPQASQILNTLKGIRVIDENTIEVYTDFWHFDSGEISSWGSVWSSMPWEIMASMEKIDLILNFFLMNLIPLAQSLNASKCIAKIILKDIKGWKK